jgi:DNA-binding NarL/FixJ family response regulator
MARPQDGMRNAATLRFIRSPAESHVEQILTKLGFTSRAQVAAWVAAS